MDTDGIEGDGTIALVFFKVLGSQAESALTLESVAAHDATSLIDAPGTTIDGSFNSSYRSSSPEIVFGGTQ